MIRSSAIVAIATASLLLGSAAMAQSTGNPGNATNGAGMTGGGAGGSNASDPLGATKPGTQDDGTAVQGGTTPMKKNGTTDGTSGTTTTP